MPKILYIAGYGRCGSTVLDTVLGNHSQIASTGEVSFLLSDWSSPNRKCSCGEPFGECDYWKGLFPDHPPEVEMARIMRRMESLPFLPRLLSGVLAEGERRVYKDFQQKLYGYIAGRNRKSIVVDSSKSARGNVGRALALKKLAGLDVYMVHLVRNGFSTMESLHVTGSNWTMEGYRPETRRPPTRTALGWVSANLWAPILGRVLGRNRYMCVRFEDLLSHPSQVLADIGRFCGFDPLELIARVNDGGRFQVGHTVGGNRARLKQEITLNHPSQERPGDLLSPHERLAFSLIGGWLNRRYGYNGGPGR